MKKILIIMGFADCGGISAVILNYIQNLSLNEYHFDLALTSSTVGMNAHKMKELGAEIYHLPLKSENLKGFREGLYKILTENEYDCIHVNGNLTSFVALQVAKKAGVKCRIAHSHNAPRMIFGLSYIKKMCYNLLNCYFGTKLIGCGLRAGEYAYGKLGMKMKKSLVLPNAIYTEKFYYNPIVRDEVRSEWNIKSHYVIGCVGRLCKQKNIEFALSVMKNVYSKNNNTKMVIVGDGEDKEELLSFVQENEMTDYVIFLGKRSDVNRIYQGFDCCILTSLYEGFPVASLEAMASGLPVLLSDRITDEFKFCSFAQYIPLDVDKWSSAILEKAATEETAFRSERIKEVRNAGYDIKDAAHLLKKIYDGE